MATQFDQPRTVVQPQATEQPANLSGVFDKQAAFMSSLSSQQYALSGQLINQASAAFDQVMAVYSKDAERRATDDAAALIKFDGDGNVIAPSTFYPPGISTRAYSDRFHDVARATYNASAEAELDRHSTLMRQKYAGDPAAYAAAMDDKRQQMQVNLDPQAAPWIDLRARQIQAQGTSILAVQQQSDVNKNNATVADEKFEGIKLDAMQLAGFQTAYTGGKATPEELNDLIINSSMLGQRWKEQEVLWRNAGRNQAFIDEQRRNLSRAVVIKNDTEVIKNNVKSYYDPVTGYPSPGRMADARETIRQQAQTFAHRFPGHEQEYYDAGMKALEFATSQAGLRAQQVQTDQKLANEPVQRQIMKDQAEAMRLAQAGQVEAAAAINQRLTQQGASILDNTRMADAPAMQLAATALQAGAVTRSAVQESYTTRLQGLVATIGSSEPGIGPEHKAAAYEALRTVRDDPSLQSILTSGQRSYIQGGMDSYSRAEAGGNLAAFMIKANNGESSEANTRSVFQGMIDKGQIHNDPGHILTPAEAAVMEKQANDAFKAKQTRRDLARDHKLNYDLGGAVTEDQITARAAEQPFKNLGAKPDFTPQNPAEVAQFAAYHGETGIVPAMVKQSIAAMGKSPNPLDMKGYVDTYNVVEANVARQLDRQLGPANPNDVGARNELVKAKVQAQLGEEAGYLLTVKQHGAEAAYKLDQANLSASKSGQSGGPSAELQSSLDTALDTVAGNLKGVAAGSTVLSHLLTGQVFSDQTALQSHREAAADRLLTQTPGAPGTSSSIGQFFRNAVPGLGGDDRFTGGVTYSPEARAMLKQWGTVYSAVNGKAVKDQAGGKNAEEFIVNLALEKLAPVLEAKMSPDGKNAVIGLKTFNTVLTDGLGLKKPLSADAEQGYLADFVAQERIRTGQMPLDFDRKTAMAVPVLDSNNQLTFHISVSDRQGIPVTQMTIAKDDPRLSASNLALDKAILGTIYNLKPGMSPSDAVHAASGLGRFIAGTKDYLFRQGRIERVLAGGIGGRATENAARQDFLVDFQTRLQGLDKQIGPNGPRAAEALQQMIKGPEGASIAGSSVIDQAIRWLGAGSSPPVRTGAH